MRSWRCTWRKRCLTDEAKGTFGETFHLKTVVRTGVLGINYWIEVREWRVKKNTRAGRWKMFAEFGDEDHIEDVED